MSETKLSKSIIYRRWFQGARFDWTGFSTFCQACSEVFSTGDVVFLFTETAKSTPVMVSVDGREPVPMVSGGPLPSSVAAMMLDVGGVDAGHPPALELELDAKSDDVVTPPPPAPTTAYVCIRCGVAAVSEGQIIPSGGVLYVEARHRGRQLDHLTDAVVANVTQGLTILEELVQQMKSAARAEAS